MARPQRLTTDEIQAAFEEEAVREDFLPILTVEQFAQLFQVSVATTYFWIAQDKLKGAVTKVGKHRRIWRNRAIELLFNRNQPKDKDDHDDDAHR